MTDWPEAVALSSARLLLEPLQVDHAEEMAPLLDDVALHTYIGGRPATEAELRERYERQVVGRSPDGSQRWLNWVVRRRDERRAVGTVQATIGEESAEASSDEPGDESGGVVAEVAWLLATEHQRQGYASEAARAMVAWLREIGVTRVIAHVHPDHEGSARVARAIGLVPTDAIVDGEVRWQSWTPRG